MTSNSAKIVAEYGLHWDLNQINWTWPGLIGHRGKRVGSYELADLRTLRGVYALYTKGELYYVGLTLEKGIDRRVRDHTRNRHAGQWDHFSWFSVDPVSSRHLTHHGLWQRTPPWAGSQRREVRLHVDDAVRDLEALMIHVCMGGVRGLANISQPAFVGTARPWKQVPAGEFEWFLSRHQSQHLKRSRRSA